MSLVAGRFGRVELLRTAPELVAGLMSLAERQHSGTAGRIENCQVGVFLTLARIQVYDFITSY
jgi:hypothetical protein